MKLLIIFLVSNAELKYRIIGQKSWYLGFDLQVWIFKLEKITEFRVFNITFARLIFNVLQWKFEMIGIVQMLPYYMEIDWIKYTEIFCWKLALFGPN